MKPIFISQEEKEKLIREFSANLDKSLYEGTCTFSKSFTYNEKDHTRATLVYTPEAFAKTVSLLFSFDSEVAWHGLIRRGAEEGVYIIYDVIVYPQEVTGSTVNTDDEGYTKFMIQLTEEQANAMHAQCHSHVNMATSPSVVDKTHQEQVLKTMNGQGFYVFQIWNKRLETTNFIYDFDHNVMYEDKDIDLEVVDNDGFCISDIVADAKKIVKTKTYAKSSGSSYSSGYSYDGNYGSNYYSSGYYSSGNSYYSGSKKEDDTDPVKKDKKGSKIKQKKVAPGKRFYVNDDLYWDEDMGCYVDAAGYIYDD